MKVSKLFPLFIIIYEMSVNLSNDMYLPAVSSMMQFFQVDNYFIQLSITAWFAGTMAMNPVLGVLSDNMGRKQVLMKSGLIFLAATLYCSFPMSNIYLFLFARFLQGMSVTTIIVCGYALIHELYNNKQAIHIIAWMTGAMVIAPMLGPLMGGYILALLSWNYIFLILFIIAAASLIGLHYAMPNININQADANKKIDLKSELEALRKILLYPKFILGCLIYAALFGGLIAWLTASPFLFIVDFHYSPVMFGLIQVPVFGSYILGILLLQTLMKLDYQEEVIIKVGLFVAAVASMAALCLITTNHLSLILLTAYMCIYSLAFGMIASPLSRMTVMSIDQGMGKKMAMFDIILSIVATIATLSINVDAASLMNYTGICVVLFVLSAVPFYVLHFKCSVGVKRENSIAS